jgi:hypothetical protein
MYILHTDIFLFLWNVVYFNFLYACFLSSSCTASVNIFSPNCHRHVTLNGRMCRLTMYFSLFLFCHAVFSCFVFRFKLHHLLEISRAATSVLKAYKLKKCRKISHSETPLLRTFPSKLEYVLKTELGIKYYINSFITLSEIFRDQ